MDDLVEYIKRTALARYRDWHEYDEVIQQMYIVIQAAVYEKADDLRVSRDSITYSSNDVVLRQRDISFHEQNYDNPERESNSNYTSYREALKLILSHDPRIREHIQVVEETPDVLRCRLVQ